LKICLLMVPILFLAASMATGIRVAPNGADYSNLQAALKNASFGDLIEVRSGTYNESVYVDKQVELKGIDTGGGLPIINAHRIGSVITLLADGIVLEGFNLTNSGHCGCGNAGIYIASNNSTILRNVAYRGQIRGLYQAR
jgi:nitrous oxidase accessory protein NosD